MTLNFKFEELRVYQEGLVFVDKVYDLTGHWPKTEMFGLSDQLKRAAGSIVLNIAEGSSRTVKEFRHFLGMSRGSCYECVAILTIAKGRGYLSESEFGDLYEICNKLSRSISALKVSLR